MSPTGPIRTDGPARSPWQFLTLDLPRGTGFGRHRHDEHQLVVVEAGVLALVTPGRSWALPAGAAVWLPSGDDHEVAAVTDSRATFAYRRGDLIAAALDGAGAVSVAPLLRQVVTTLSTPNAARGPRREHLEAVLDDEVAELRPVQLLVPMPTDAAARAASEILLADPTDHRALADLGRVVGASARTLQRRFVEETGFGFRAWRSRARLQRAMAELDGGASVTAAGIAAGFSSSSAFVNAFRTELGETPAAWARRADEGRAAR